MVTLLSMARVRILTRRLQLLPAVEAVVWDISVKAQEGVVAASMIIRRVTQPAPLQIPAVREVPAQYATTRQDSVAATFQQLVAVVKGGATGMLVAGGFNNENVKIQSLAMVHATTPNREAALQTQQIHPVLETQRVHLGLPIRLLLRPSYEVVRLILS
jgi:hypothetical protein